MYLADDTRACTDAAWPGSPTRRSIAPVSCARSACVVAGASTRPVVVALAGSCVVDTGLVN